MTKVWVSRDKGIYEGIWLWDCLPVWGRDDVAYCNGDGTRIYVCKQFGLKPGQCAEFEVRRVK